MGFLARLLGAAPKADWGGIRLQSERPWCVSPVRDYLRFLRALPLLAPEGTVVYFEGTGEAHVAEYLEGVAIAPPVKVALGTIWPKPDVYHVPLTATTIEELCAFLEREPAGYLCTHCHVHRDGVVLLEWHDAFGDDPMYVSQEVAEDVVASFAGAMGSSYSPSFGG